MRYLVGQWTHKCFHIAPNGHSVQDFGHSLKVVLVWVYNEEVSTDEWTTGHNVLVTMKTVWNSSSLLPKICFQWVLMKSVVANVRGWTEWKRKDLMFEWTNFSRDRSWIELNWTETTIAKKPKWGGNCYRDQKPVVYRLIIVSGKSHPIMRISCSLSWFINWLFAIHLEAHYRQKRTKICTFHSK